MKEGSKMWWKEVPRRDIVKDAAKAAHSMLGGSTRHYRVVQAEE